MKTSAGFKLRFSEGDISKWAAKYSYSPADMDAPIVSEIRPAVRERGYLTRDEFRTICKWKTPRSQSKCARNDEHTIRKLSRAAFATPDESLKMELLRLLDGVEWPTASTLLHFCDTRDYPILDFRALWSLGYAKPPRYTMEFCLDDVAFTRALAEKVQLPIRTVDRALWQYSKAKQR